LEIELENSFGKIFNVFERIEKSEKKTLVEIKDFNNLGKSGNIC
jgi:hypothetical protein